MNAPLPDEIDLRILECLLENAARPHKEIGRIVHLTGQAVGARVRKLEDLGIIEGYTVRWNPGKAGKLLSALVTVFMKSTASHLAFQRFIEEDQRITEAHRVSGEGCYWLRVLVDDNTALNAFLDDLLPFAYYRVSLSAGKLK